MDTKEPFRIAIAWYDPSEWDSWRQTCADGAQFFNIDYPTWKQNVESAIVDQRRAGVKVVPVVIRLEPFLEWARANDKPTTSQFRAEYAGLMAEPKATQPG